MLVLLVAVMPVVWTGETRGGVQCKLNRDARGLVVQVGAGRKAEKTRLKALLTARVTLMEEVLGGALPTDLHAILGEKSHGNTSIGSSCPVRKAQLCVV